MKVSYHVAFYRIRSSHLTSLWKLLLLPTLPCWRPVVQGGALACWLPSSSEGAEFGREQRSLRCGSLMTTWNIFQWSFRKGMLCQCCVSALYWDWLGNGCPGHGRPSLGDSCRQEKEVSLAERLWSDPVKYGTLSGCGRHPMEQGWNFWRICTKETVGYP